MKQLKFFFLLLLAPLLFQVGSLLTHAGSADNNPNFYISLNDVVNTSRNYDNGQGGIKKFLQKLGIGGWGVDANAGAQTLSDFIVEVVVKLIIPLFVFIGILIAILGFFKLMTSSDAEELKKWWNFLLRGVIGVLLMVAAWWIVATMVGVDGTGGVLGEIAWKEAIDVSGAEVAGELYGKILYPLLKVVFSIILGIMFIMAAAQGFKYLFSADDTAQKKSLQILLFTVIGILIIVLAKTFVEAVYGPYDKIVNGEAAQVTPGAGIDVGKIGDGVFTNPDFDVLYIVINRVLGLATIIIVILIIYIGYLLLFTPTSEESMTKIKKTLGWIFWGILLMGAAYLVANFVIIK